MHLLKQLQSHWVSRYLHDSSAARCSRPKDSGYSEELGTGMAVAIAIAAVVIVRERWVLAFTR